MNIRRELSILLALFLLFASIPMATAEEEASIDDVLMSLPIEDDVEEAEGQKLWTEEIAKDVAAAEAAERAGRESVEKVVSYDEDDFPDPVFWEYLKEQFDSDGDGVLSDAECGEVVEISVNEMGIQTLAGIEHFPNLEKLYCEYNALVDIDVSGNSKLTVLLCGYNDLETLDVSGNPELVELACRANMLNSLNVSNNPELLWLRCNYNGDLRELDIRQSPKLQVLEMGYSHIGTIDLSRQTQLRVLELNFTPIETVDLSACTKLEQLTCIHADLTQLNLDGQTKLIELMTYDDTRLRHIDITHCTKLRQMVDSVERLEVDERICWYDDSLSIELVSPSGALQTHSHGAMLIDDSDTLTADGEALYAPTALGSITDAKITGIKATAAYTGSAIKPKPVVKYNGETLIEDVDYKVTYKNNKKVGKATVTIKGINGFTGTVKKTFKINPKKVALTKLTAGTGKLTVQWKKSAGAGYEIQYGLKKNFSGAKSVTISKTGTVKKVLKNLKSGKVYYVRIRGYKKVGGKAYVSKWSKALKKKVK